MRIWWDENKTKIKGFIIFSIICILSFFGVYFFNTMKAKADNISLEQKNDDAIELKNVELDSSSESKEENKIKVDIKGAVKNPGVYEIENNKRVVDLIELAGGILKTTDTSVINLSKRLSDEMVVILYTKDEIEKYDETKEKEEIKKQNCSENNKNITNNACVNSKDEAEDNNNSKININTAGKEELSSLNGIGESKAEAIIEYRNKNGKFKDINDILNVSGIGKTVFDKIKENITI